jgi:TPR repeat protein
MAQKYLDGSAGTKNDAEAAQWLWKAVSKRNLPATKLLADMYLRGNGVSKNCDQARILLDAAAARGAKDAAFRLRNIQSFGCQ